MKFGIGLTLILALSAGAFAQHERGGPVAAGAQSPQGFIRSVPPSPFPSSGFGSVVFPGAGAPPSSSRYGGSSGFGSVLFPGAGGPGGRPGGGYNGFRKGGAYGRGYAGYPMIWPILVGGDYGYGGYDSYDAGGYNGYAPYAQPAPNITIVMPPATPPVVVQGYAPEQARPELREYGPEGGQAGTPQPGGTNVRIYSTESSPRPAPPDDQVYFFIALKDSSVYTAVAYWVEDGMLHYVTPQGRHNQVSLDLVDRDVSGRLNAERNMEFHLPAAK